MSEWSDDPVAFDGGPLDMGQAALGPYVPTDDPFIEQNAAEEPIVDDTFPGEDLVPFDSTDQGTAALARQVASSFSLGGKYGLQYRNDNLGTTPSLAGGALPAYAMARGGGSMNAARAQAAARRGAILTAISNRLGRRIALHAVAALVGKWGLPAAAAALGVGADDLLFLIAQYAGMKGHRGKRGPHLHTVIKRIRRGRRYEKMLRHWSAKAGVHRHAAFGGGHRRKHTKGRK